MSKYIIVKLNQILFIKFCLCIFLSKSFQNKKKICFVTWRGKITSPHSTVAHHLVKVRFLETSNILDPPRNSLVIWKGLNTFFGALALTNEGRDHLPEVTASIEGKQQRMHTNLTGWDCSDKGQIVLHISLTRGILAVWERVTKKMGTWASFMWIIFVSFHFTSILAFRGRVRL